MRAASFVPVIPSNKEIALAYIWSYLGKWYKWGGDDPSGFDCSGLVCEYLKSCGLLDRKADMTAADLWNIWPYKRIEKGSRGCLVFWASEKGSIIHVEIMLNDELSIGASGGGSKTLTEVDAIKDNAFIKIRKAATRAGIYGYVDPFMS